MAEPVGSRSVGGGTGVDNDWTVQATDTVERLVATVRSRTTRPAIVAARAVVYGVLGAILGIAALILLAIAAVRVIDVYVPGEVWAAHLIVGVLFTALGLVAWRSRRVRDTR
jgi:hypothetical protein